MNAKDVLRASMDLGEHILKTYVSDLTDMELMLRPVAGCNHLAWQLGHLIQSERGLRLMVCQQEDAPLPEGFAEQHSKSTASCDDATKFLTKARYVELFEQQRAATKAALDTLSEADLDRAGPPDFQMCPTVGSVFNLIASHVTMHAGQFVPVRRQLGKPVLI